MKEYKINIITEDNERDFIIKLERICTIISIQKERNEQKTN